jgi:hypothetical protein
MAWSHQPAAISRVWWFRLCELQLALVYGSLAVVIMPYTDVQTGASSTWARPLCLRVLSCACTCWLALSMQVQASMYGKQPSSRWPCVLPAIISSCAMAMHTQALPPGWQGMCL